MKSYNFYFFLASIISICFIFGISISLYQIYVESNRLFLTMSESRLSDEKFYQDVCKSGTFAKDHDRIRHDCSEIAITLNENIWMTAVAQVLSTRGFCATESCTKLISENFNFLLSINNVAIVLCCILCFISFKLYVNSLQQPNFGMNQNQIGTFDR